jgi:transcriptional regulator GlxA family with amidase domain
VRPGAATAVAHPKKQEQADEFLRASQTFLSLSLVLPAVASAGRKLYGEPLATTELCELIGVTERTLRSCCAEFLGMSPTRYVLLRRLSRARVALRDADPDRASLSELVRTFGFAELGRFETAYRAAFGETPLTTLQRAPAARFINP